MRNYRSILLILTFMAISIFVVIYTLFSYEINFTKKIIILSVCIFIFYRMYLEYEKLKDIS
jgi:hypothetical protein